ncbi:MAG TPA: DinB family protein [Thermomicrobiales bacterium]|jgi:hypothetical protein
MVATHDPAVISAQQIGKAYARNVWLIQRQTEGLTHAESLLQPPMRGNCLNWTLGHLAVHRDYVLEALGQEKVLGDTAVARYGRESAPILGDGDGVLPLEGLLTALEQGQERIDAAIEQLTSEDLAREITFGRAMPLGEALFFLYFHDTYHTGQTEPLRQLAGKNDKIL